MSKMETRLMPQEMEIRETDDGKRTVHGYAVKWEQLSQKLGYFYRFRERFRRGAFADSLTEDDQRALWNHNADIVLGRTKSETLRLEEDDIGLRFELDMPDTSWGNDIYTSVKRGDIDGVSFGFSVKTDGEEWDENDPDNIVRTITSAKLYEISPTPFPAYLDSEVSARNIEEAYKSYYETGETKEQRDWIQSIRKKINS